MGHGTSPLRVARLERLILPRSDVQRRFPEQADRDDHQDDRKATLNVSRREAARAPASRQHAADHIP